MTDQRTITISRRTRRLMFIEAQHCGDHNLEVGGGLYGNANRDSAVTVSEAQRPGRTTRATKATLAFNWDSLEAGEHDEHTLVGFWHSHPSGSAPQLSRADVQAFGDIHRNWRTPIPQFVAMLVTPHQRDGWNKPQLHAWLMWTDNQDVTRYEPVTVDLWGSEPDPWPHPSAIRKPRDPDDYTPEGRARRLAALRAGTPADPATTEEPRERQQHVSTRRPRRPAIQEHVAKAVLVATRTFTAIDGGEPVTVKKGELVYDPGHSLVKANPDAFKRR